MRYSLEKHSRALREFNLPSIENVVRIGNFSDVGLVLGFDFAKVFYCTTV